MQLVLVDATLAELVQLDVLDVRLDGSYVLNPAFRAAAVAAYQADPLNFDQVFQDLILDRAAERGYAVLDVTELALRALEVATDEPEASA